MSSDSPPSEPGRRRNFVSKIAGTFTEFDKLETSGSIVLVACALIAVAVANSPMSESYFGYWDFKTPVLGLTVKQWVNDGLMALFFFLVGLEIKRELVIGELSSFRRALLPILAAVGGMVVPALIYVWFNSSGPGQRGWGIPMATDIAFSLGVLALLGSRVPIGIKVFLTALAIADDLGAVAVIALFYTPNFDPNSLLIALGVLTLAAIVARLGWDSPWLYLLLGPAVWFFTHESGVHATLAGVAMAFIVPARRRLSGVRRRVLEISLLEGMLHRLHPWVTYAVIPVFALANAGVSLGGTDIGGPISMGIAAGLVLGKPIGIVVCSAIAVRLGLASLPRGVGWGQVWGAGLLAGIGFTMSLFIAELAFGPGENLDISKAGIFGASMIAALAGYIVMRASIKGPSEVESREASA